MLNLETGGMGNNGGWQKRGPFLFYFEREWRTVLFTLLQNE